MPYRKVPLPRTLTLREDVVVMDRSAVSLAFLAGLLGVAVACSGSTGDPTTPATLTESTGTVIPSPGTQPVVTTTTSSTPPPDGSATGWRVVDVDADDELNVRSGPGTGFEVIGGLAHDAQNVELVGDFAQIGGTGWARLTSEGVTGWSSMRFLAGDPIEESVATAALEDGASTYPVATWRVADVVLNVRAGPGVSHSVIDQLDPNTDGLRSTGNFAWIDGDAWLELQSNGRWAIARYLSRSEADAVLAECPFELATGANSHSGASSGLADRVSSFAVSTRGDPDSFDAYCERVAITLSGGSLGEASVAMVSSFLRIELTGVEGADRGAGMALPDTRLVHSIFTVHPREGEYDMYVDLHFNAPTAASVDFTSSPPQIIVDLVPEIPVMRSYATPDLTPAIVLTPLPVSQIGLTTYPVEVYGYAIPFESSMRAVAVSASGAPVVIQTDDGSLHDGAAFIRSSYLEDPTGIVTWGEFSFEIVDGPLNDNVTLTLSEDGVPSVIEVSFSPVS